MTLTDQYGEQITVATEDLSPDRPTAWLIGGKLWTTAPGRTTPPQPDVPARYRGWRTA